MTVYYNFTIFSCLFKHSRLYILRRSSYAQTRSMSTGVTLEEKRNHEWLAYTDCLYRSLHARTHLFVLDADEIVLPAARGANRSDWKQMLRELEAVDNDASYDFSFNTFFFLDSMNEPLPTEEASRYMRSQIVRGGEILGTRQACLQAK